MRISDWSSDVCSSDLLKRPHHGFDLGHFFLEPLDMFERESLDVGAGAASVGPEAQQLADLLHGKAKITRAPDEAQAVHVGVVIVAVARVLTRNLGRSEEHTSELQSLMRISYAVFFLKKTHNKRLMT